MASKGNYLPTWTTVTPVKQVDKKATVTPILPPMIGGKLVAPVLPAVPVKLATPVTPPVAKKNETPVGSLGPVVTKSESVDYTDPELFMSQVPRYPKFLEESSHTGGAAFNDRLGRINEEYTEDKKLGKHLDKAAAAFAANPGLRARYEELLSAARSYGITGKIAIRTAALNMYRDIRDFRSSDLPETAIPKLLSIKGSEPLLGFVSGNLRGKRENFTRRYVNGGNVPDRMVYDVIAADLKSLSPAGQETYLTLLQGWEGTHKELAAAAKSLSQD